MTPSGSSASLCSRRDTCGALRGLAEPAQQGARRPLATVIRQLFHSPPARARPQRVLGNANPSSQPGRARALHNVFSSASVASTLLRTSAGSRHASRSAGTFGWAAPMRTVLCLSPRSSRVGGGTGLLARRLDAEGSKTQSGNAIRVVFMALYRSDVGSRHDRCHRTRRG